MYVNGAQSLEMTVANTDSPPLIFNVIAPSQETQTKRNAQIGIGAFFVWSGLLL
jgi:hypothetical protein